MESQDIIGLALKMEQYLEFSMQMLEDLKKGTICNSPMIKPFCEKAEITKQLVIMFLFSGELTYLLQGCKSNKYLFLCKGC